MIELVISSQDIAVIRDRLTSGAVEGCSILYASQVTRDDGKVRLLTREVQFPDQDDYTKQGKIEAELKPEFVAKVTKRAFLENLSLVFVHSHLGYEAPLFSQVDTLGEKLLSDFLGLRHPNHIHVALVISLGGLRARRLGTDCDVKVISIGAFREVLFDSSDDSLSLVDVFDRQIRAFGESGQKALQQLRIAIVGLGGTGSIIAQQLVHLGVRNFILIDPDVIELTNLNRVVNAFQIDVGQPKVKIAARYITQVAKDANIECLQGDIIRSSIAHTLLNADIIFGCTDSHGSRAVLQQVSYQYFIPCIDVGTTIIVSNGQVKHIYGRVQLLSPDHACLTCSNLLDSNEVRRDMMNAFERQADPYIQGIREPAPAVISINGTIVSLACSMLLSVVTGVPINARYILYNATNSTLRSINVQPVTNCFICSKSGSYARGDTWPLLTRQD